MRQSHPMGSILLPALALLSLVASPLGAQEDVPGRQRAEAQLASLPKTHQQLAATHGDTYGDPDSPFWVAEEAPKAYYVALRDGLVERLSRPQSASDRVGWDVLNQNLERFPDLGGVIEALAVHVVPDMSAYLTVGRRVVVPPFEGDDEDWWVGDLGHTEPAPFAVMTLACGLRHQRGRLTDAEAKTLAARALALAEHDGSYTNRVDILLWGLLPGDALEDDDDDENHPAWLLAQLHDRGWLTEAQLARLTALPVFLTDRF